MRQEGMDMRSRISGITINKRFISFLALGICICALCMACMGMTVRAQSGNFAIDANLVPSDGNTYDISLTVGNMGNDWEGTVRLSVGREYISYGNTAYDTALSLPQGSTKSFVVKIPKSSVESTEARVNVELLDKKSNVIEEADFNRILRDDADALALGILSDGYSALTYLDMGGEEIYYYSENYPIRLVEINQDNLETSLASLAFLVIDNYNTEILSQEAISAIDSWTNAGGVLIIGTGSHGEETLSGFDYLGIHYDGIQKLEEDGYVGNGWVDLSKLTMAELTDWELQYSQAYESLAILTPMGSGAVGVLPYALSDLKQLDAFDDSTGGQRYFVRCILEDVSNEAQSRYWAASASSNNRYFLRRIINNLGNGDSRLNFGILKVIVILYVIFVGPVLYLVLRMAKKREMYWMAVPVASLMGIFLIFCAGRGFEVVGTRVYSVTVSDLSNPKNTQTYLHCYDADHGEWDLQLAEGYESVGPLANSSYNYNNSDKYYYHVQREGERLSFGMNPNTSFEDGYLVTGNSPSIESGSLELSDFKAQGWSVPAGTISNRTNKDFPYVAVIANEMIFIYRNLPAGTTCSLSDLEIAYDGSQHYSVTDAYMYNFMEDAYEDNKNDIDIIAALGLGIYQAYPQDDASVTLVIGVTKDWDKAVDDSCREMSYGCLYMIQ